MELQMRAIDELEAVESRSYPPLYEPQSYTARNMQSSTLDLSTLELPSFAAQIMHNEERIVQDLKELASKHQHDDTDASTPRLPPFISSVKVVIKEGRIDVNEDCDKNIDEMEMVDPTVSSLPAQTYRLEFKGLSVSHIIKHEVNMECATNWSKVAYVTLKIHDVTLLEFDEVLEPFTDCVCSRYLSIHNRDGVQHRQVNGKALPLLFKVCYPVSTRWRVQIYFGGYISLFYIDFGAVYDGNDGQCSGHEPTGRV